MTNCREATSQQMGKMLWKMAVLPLTVDIRIKGQDDGGRGTGDSLAAD